MALSEKTEKTIRLSEEAFLQCCSPGIPENKNCPAVLVLPGGGYHWCFPGEAEAPAGAFTAAGYRSFILYYTTRPLPLKKQPLTDAARAVRYLRVHAKELAIDPQWIVLCGFSAGAHLAASLAVLAGCPETADCATADCRPDAVVLCYPVISSGRYCHKGSMDNLCGDDEGLRQLFSLERQVRPDTSPCFIWHALDDADVPAENSLLMAEALKKNGVPFELHIFGTGAHGTAMCTGESGQADPHSGQWFPLCLQWLNRILKNH